MFKDYFHILTEARLFFGPNLDLVRPLLPRPLLKVSYMVGWDCVNRSVMAPKSSDSWLWVTLGQYSCCLATRKLKLRKAATLGYFGSFAVHRQLVAIRQASEVTRRDKRPNISQQTEDGTFDMVEWDKNQTKHHQR